MKKKFNIKLTMFLVSLFVSLIILILGNKNIYCLSFGFILVGVSLALFSIYNKEKTQQQIELLDEEIANVIEDEESFETEEEKVFSLKQLYSLQGKLQKHRKKVDFVFITGAILLVIVGIINLF